MIISQPEKFDLIQVETNLTDANQIFRPTNKFTQNDINQSLSEKPTQLESQKLTQFEVKKASQNNETKKLSKEHNQMTNNQKLIKKSTKIDDTQILIKNPPQITNNQKWSEKSTQIDDSQILIKNPTQITNNQKLSENLNQININQNLNYKFAQIDDTQKPIQNLTQITQNNIQKKSFQNLNLSETTTLSNRINESTQLINSAQKLAQFKRENPTIESELNDAELNNETNSNQKCFSRLIYSFMCSVLIGLIGFQLSVLILFIFDRFYWNRFLAKKFRRLF